MSDLVARFKEWLPNTSPKDRADALKVIEQQIEMTMGNIQDVAKHIDGTTPKYAQACGSLIEKRRQDIQELEEVKGMFKAAGISN